MGALLPAWTSHITQASETLHPNLICLVILPPIHLNPYTSTRIFESVSVLIRASYKQFPGSMIYHLSTVIRCLRGSKFQQPLLPHSIISDSRIHPRPRLKAFPTLSHPTSQVWRIILTQSLRTLLIKHPLLSAIPIILHSSKTAFFRTIDRFKNLAFLPAELSSLHYTLCVIIHIEEIQWMIKHCDFCALGLLDVGGLVQPLDTRLWPSAIRSFLLLVSVDFAFWGFYVSYLITVYLLSMSLGLS